MRSNHRLDKKKKSDLLHLPSRSTKWLSDEPNSLRDVTDTLNVHTDMHTAGNEMETAENVGRNVSMHQTEEKTKNSPKIHKITMFKSADRWKRVSANGIDMYVPWNMSIEASGQMFEFGWFQSIGEAIAPDIENKGVVEGNGD